MNQYLTKPFSITELTEVLRDFLGDSIGNVVPNGVTRHDSNGLGSPAQTAETRAEVINKQAVENIREVEKQTGRSILPTIFEGFQSQMNEKIQELEADLNSGDAQAVYRTAHAIKSMSANIGAEQVRRHSSRIEIIGRSGSCDGVEIKIQPLKDSYEEFTFLFDLELKAQSH
jgi:HPt (histidine-containing phosphotransfer) domain-containing protein